VGEADTRATLFSKSGRCALAVDPVLAALLHCSPSSPPDCRDQASITPASLSLLYMLQVIPKKMVPNW